MIETPPVTGDDRIDEAMRQVVAAGDEDLAELAQRLGEAQNALAEALRDSRAAGPASASGT